ncbi:hypothetical protein [Pseudozobellia thermophila]|uniref:Uncharacterized protein n=1 Tax=Pseudozobellia thermophila TaxID=192903 RepID=A0A1M6EUX0_9FLAO|nr:hypothetical protein [Pseudozobellia thermophila]SHI89274.1 hypothetical protein SAMN04488513_102189 [Pseudozobellia thermophila]
MKAEVKTRCAFCHDVIETQHVFCEGDQVYLKGGNENPLTEEEWYPINFQWISVVRLEEHLR